MRISKMRKITPKGNREGEKIMNITGLQASGLIFKSRMVTRTDLLAVLRPETKQSAAPQAARPQQKWPIQDAQNLGHLPDSKALRVGRHRGELIDRLVKS